MNLDKMANQDAHSWARAEMFFGQGAGTRRKLLAAELEQKMRLVPGYETLFKQACEKQNMAEHALAAMNERKRLDMMAKTGQNLRALKSGNIRGLSNGVFVVVGIGLLAHKTGYDKVIAREAKVQYTSLKAKIKEKRAAF